MNGSLVIFILTLINFAFQLDFVILMPLGQSIMDQYQLTPVEFSSVVSVYTIASGIASLVYSLLGAEFNKKMMLIFSIFLLGCSSFLTGMTSTFNELFFIRLFSGIFSGILNSLLFALATDHIPISRRGKAMAWILSGFSFASIFGVPLGLYLTDHYSFKLTYICIAMVFAIVMFMSIVILPNDQKSEKFHFNTMITHFGRCLKNTDYWKGYFLLFFVSGAIFVVVPLLSPFIIKNMKMKITNLEQMYLCGGILTVLISRFIGMLCDKKGPKLILNIVGILSTIVVIIFVNSGESSVVYFLLIGSLMISMMSGLIVPSMTISSFFPSKEDSGVYNGILNSVRSFGSGVFSYFAGIFILTDPASGKFNNFDLVGIIYFAIITIVLLLNLMSPKRYAVPFDKIN